MTDTGKYVRAKDRQERWVPAIVDLVILKALPNEGTLVGYHPVAKTIKGLVKELGGGLTADQMNGRLASLREYGFVISLKLIPVAQGMGFQRTKAGREALERNRHLLPKTTTGTEA